MVSCNNDIILIPGYNYNLYNKNTMYIEQYNDVQFPQNKQMMKYTVYSYSQNISRAEIFED